MVRQICFIICAALLITACSDDENVQVQTVTAANDNPVDVVVKYFKASQVENVEEILELADPYALQGVGMYGFIDPITNSIESWENSTYEILGEEDHGSFSLVDAQLTFNESGNQYLVTFNFNEENNINSISFDDKFWIDEYIPNNTYQFESPEELIEHFFTLVKQNEHKEIVFMMKDYPSWNQVLEPLQDGSFDWTDFNYEIVNHSEQTAHETKTEVMVWNQYESQTIGFYTDCFVDTGCGLMRVDYNIPAPGW